MGFDKKVAKNGGKGRQKRGRSGGCGGGVQGGCRGSSGGLQGAFGGIAGGSFGGLQRDSGSDLQITNSFCRFMKARSSCSTTPAMCGFVR